MLENVFNRIKNNNKENAKFGSLDPQQRAGAKPKGSWGTNTNSNDTDENQNAKMPLYKFQS